MFNDPDNRIRIINALVTPCHRIGPIRHRLNGQRAQGGHGPFIHCDHFCFWRRRRFETHDAGLGNGDDFWRVANQTGRRRDENDRFFGRRRRGRGFWHKFWHLVDRRWRRRRNRRPGQHRLIICGSGFVNILRNRMSSQNRLIISGREFVNIRQRRFWR